MRHLAAMAARSAWNRRLALGMTLVAVAASVALLLGVERVREGARQGFSQSVSGIDLVVGPRTSPTQVILYAVFRMGDPMAGMRWSSYEGVARHPAVAWTVPLSLGDSHHGFPVLATTRDYFSRFRYGESRPLAIASGRAFESTFEAVVGSEVAARLGYRAGSSILITHGMGDSGLAEHADKPFAVTGVLAPTGTPVDRTVHIGLDGLEAIHLDWQGGAPMPGMRIPADQVRKFDLQPKTITAMLVGLESRAAVFAVQRFVNEYPPEALVGVLPGVALDELWETLETGQRALLAVSALVVVVGLLGLVAVILASLGERRRELAILRSVGASPSDVLVLLTLEGLWVMLSGVLLGLALLYLATALLAPLAQAHYGIAVAARLVQAGELRLLGAVIAAGVVASLLPGLRAYRLSLGDGLSPRS